MKIPFYIVGVRHNPQLGSYLSKAIVAAGVQNKASITAKFEEYGSTTSVKFNIGHDNDGCHYAKSSPSCVYGSYSYYGYHSKDDAINALKKWLAKPGASADRAKDAIAKFEAA